MGARFLTVGKRDKYGKGESRNKSCAVRLELKVSVQKLEFNI